MGWTKVCGTTANLDHVRVEWMKRGAYKTAWVTPGHDCLCSYTSMDMERRSDHKLITPSGMEGSHPSYHLGVVRRMCQRG